MCDSLEVSQTSEDFVGEYYRKFQAGINLIDPSMTQSKVSNLDDNTQMRVIQYNEMYINEMAKNQFLEESMTRIQQQLSNTLEQNKLLMQQIDDFSHQLQESRQREEKVQKNYEIEKLLNQQLTKKMADQQQLIGSLQKRLREQQQYSRSYQSVSTSSRKGLFKAVTEDSTLKDTSGEVLEERPKQLRNDIYSQTAQNFFTPSPTKLPSQKNALEKRIEATLTQIRQIKQQFQIGNRK
ncbi:hypothetical protein pb186bvf_008517 [Paramecium bursaria]